MVRKTDEEKLKLMLKDAQLSKANRFLLNGFAAFRLKNTLVPGVLADIYTLHKLAVELDKEFYKISATEIDSFLKDIDVKDSAKRSYKNRIKMFYRWVKEHKKMDIDEDIFSHEIKIEFGNEPSIEEKFKRRVDWILTCKELSVEQRETLVRYVNEKKVNGVSYSGIVNKMYFLKRFALFIKKPFKEATKDDIANFLGENSGNSEASGNSYKSFLKDFFKWLEGYEETYPPIVKWLNTRKRKVNERLAKEIITDKEIKKMLQFAGNQRDRTIIFLLRDSGARVGELINLDVSSIEFKNRSAFLKLRGKTGERKVVVINCVAELRLWMNNHPFKDTPKAPLFFATNPSRYGQRLRRNGIAKMLNELSERAGIKKHIHPHLFRHTCLTKMASMLSESELKVFAGWSRASKMAEVYVHLTEDDVTRKILVENGIIEEEEMEKPKNELKEILCPNTACGFTNPSESGFCNRCGSPLTMRTAMKAVETKEKDDKTVMTLTQQMHTVQRQMQDIFEEINNIQGGKKWQPTY